MIAYFISELIIGVICGTAITVILLRKIRQLKRAEATIKHLTEQRDSWQTFAERWRRAYRDELESRLDLQDRIQRNNFTIGITSRGGSA